MPRRTATGAKQEGDGTTVMSEGELVLARPPFNLSSSGGECLCEVKGWQYGVPPAGRAHIVWAQL